MEKPANRKAMTTKLTGFIGFCLVLWLAYLLIDVGFALWSTAISAGNGQRTLFTEATSLYSIVVTAYLFLAVFDVACLVLFWTRRVFARRLVTALLGLVVVCRVFELVLAFMPEVTNATGPSAALTEAIIVKILLGILIPILFLVYLLKPERKPAPASDAPAPSGE